MSLIKKIFTCIFLLFVLKACVSKGCKDYQEVMIDNVILDYFGMYRSGSYWVYQDQNHEKIDSLYVIYYNKEMVKFGGRKPTCYKNEEIEVHLKSIGKSLIREEYAIFYLQDNSYRAPIGENASKRVGKMQAIYTNGDTLLGEDCKKITNCLLNNITYLGEISQVGIEDPIYIQKNIGVIGWINNKDTFNLIRYYIAP